MQQPESVANSATNRMTSAAYERIYSVVRRVPRGRVATYGQIACLAGIHGQARQVGYALHALRTGNDVPWHRVINAQGRISKRSSSDYDELQRILLEAEGIVFDRRGRVSLERFRWEPHARRLANERRYKNRQKKRGP